MVTVHDLASQIVSDSAGKYGEIHLALIGDKVGSLPVRTAEECEAAKDAVLGLYHEEMAPKDRCYLIRVGRAVLANKNTA